MLAEFYLEDFTVFCGTVQQFQEEHPTICQYLLAASDIRKKPEWLHLPAPGLIP
jgi:hypothetical protein